MRCSPGLGGELLCALKQLRHYHSLDELFWDEWPLSHREVERIDLENAANPEEVDELEEMTADEIKKVPTRTGPRCAPSACHPC